MKEDVERSGFFLTQVQVIGSRSKSTAEFDTQLSHDTFPKMILFLWTGTGVHCSNARLGKNH